MLEGKSPNEVFHWLLRVNALGGDGFLEACDYFEREKNENNWNLDEKIIMACCLLNISLAASGRSKKEEIEEKQESIRDFYFATYDICAPGTRDYMKDYEEKMNRTKEMFKGLHDFVDNNYQKVLKK